MLSHIDAQELQILEHISHMRMDISGVRIIKSDHICAQSIIILIILESQLPLSCTSAKLVRSSTSDTASSTRLHIPANESPLCTREVFLMFSTARRTSPKAIWSGERPSK